jgi:hypothetical protein
MQTGLRRQRLVPYDDAFLLATMPSTRKGTAKIVANRGVQINGLYYWTRGFSDPVLIGEHVPIRYDPFDVGIAFAYVRSRWERCFSQYGAVFRGRSEREVQLATAELKKQRQEHGRSFTVTAKRLAGFLQATAVDEELNTQRLRDGEFARTHHAVAAAFTERGLPSPSVADTPVANDDEFIDEVIYPIYPAQAWPPK